MVNIEDNLTTDEMYKIIHLTLLLNPEVSIVVENSKKLKPVLTEEEDSYVAELAINSLNSNKVVPGNIIESDEMAQ